MKKQYYVVWKGREVGVFDNWNETKEQVHRYSDAQYKGGFKTKEDAEAAFALGYEEFMHQQNEKGKRQPLF